MTEPRDEPDRHPERPATRPPEHPAERPTAEQLRGALDLGQGRDKVAHSDPAAAPLGTDDEAAGTPITPEQASLAHAHEIRGGGQSASANATDASPSTTPVGPGPMAGDSDGAVRTSTGTERTVRDGLGTATPGSGLPGTGMPGTGTRAPVTGQENTGHPGVGGVYQPTDPTQSHATQNTPAGAPETRGSGNMLWIGLAVLALILLVMWWR
jgi:hypothetical protein